MNFFPVFGTKSRFIEAFLLLKLRFFKCFVKNLFFGTGAGRSRAFLGGAGAQKKISGAGAEEKWKGSATLRIGMGTFLLPS